MNTSDHLSICLVAWDYPLPNSISGSGIGSSTYTLAHGLAELGCTVHVIVLYAEGMPQDFVDRGVHVHQVAVGDVHYYFSRLPLLGKWTSLIQFVRYLEVERAISLGVLRLLAENKLDIVEMPNVRNPFWLMSSKLRRLPLVVWVHGATFLYKEMLGRHPGRLDRLQETMDRQLLKASRLVNCPSKFLGDYYRAVVGNKIRVLPYPAPVEYFQPSPSRSNGSTNHENSLMVLAASPLGWPKGVDVLATAIPSVLKRVPNATFVLAGQDDTYTARELEAGFARLGIQDKIMLTGHLPFNSIIDSYRRCAVFVTATRWDNSPLSIIEAMAAGKPVVATNIGGVPELVVNGENGLLVPIGDPSALADALVALLENKDLRDKMGAAGRSRAERFHHPLSVARTRKAIYHSVIGNGN